MREDVCIPVKKHAVMVWTSMASLLLSIKDILHGLFQKKSEQGGLRICFFEKTLEFFFFFTWPPEIQDKKLNPWIFHKIVLDSLEIPRAKTKPLDISHYFFLVTFGEFHFVFN